mmetsp:Transcript_22346/g.48830  ORF Transcript_22346/g.48830 Transcript_22346/m.48830 type:complete len:587 (+) Transcript_22346:59-1819(+)
MKALSKRQVNRTLLQSSRRPGSLVSTRTHLRCLKTARPYHGLAVTRRFPGSLVIALNAVTETTTGSSIVQAPQQGASTAIVKDERIRYSFVVPEYVSSYGQVLKVVGSLPELGAWDITQAPSMQWQEGHRWKLDIQLPKQQFEFKVVMLHGDAMRWEYGVNRVVQADNSEASSAGGPPIEIVVRVNCWFDQTANTQLALMVPKEKLEEAYEVAKATLEMLQMKRSTMQEMSSKSANYSAFDLMAIDEAVTSQQVSLSSLSNIITSSDEYEPGVVMLPISAVSLSQDEGVARLAQIMSASGGAPSNRMLSAAPESQQPAALGNGSSDSAPAATSGRPPASAADARSTQSAEASRDLDSVVQRLESFFKTMESNNKSAGRVADSEGVDALQSGITQLAALMGEAEVVVQRLKKMGVSDNQLNELAMLQAQGKVALEQAARQSESALAAQAPASETRTEEPQGSVEQAFLDGVAAMIAEAAHQRGEAPGSMPVPEPPKPAAPAPQATAPVPAPTMATASFALKEQGQAPQAPQAPQGAGAAPKVDVQAAATAAPKAEVQAAASPSPVSKVESQAAPVPVAPAAAAAAER